jgi:hypothetical protein
MTKRERSPPRTPFVRTTPALLREWFSVTPAKAGVQILYSRILGNDEAKAGMTKPAATTPDMTTTIATTATTTADRIADIMFIPEFAPAV